MPERLTPEWYAFGLIDQRARARARDSLLYDELVRKRGLTGSVDAGINWGLGNMFDYSGPMLWMAQIFHDTATPSDKLLAAVDAVVERVRSSSRSTRRRSIARCVKMRSALYASTSSSSPASAAPTCSPRSRCSTTTRRASTVSRRSSPR